jgi:hypothetical protein
MALVGSGSPDMTPREREEFKQEKEAAQMQIDYQLQAKQLDLEVAKIEARWSVLLKIPIIIVRLPILILFGIALIISVITKKDLPKEFWDFIK